MKHIKNTCKLEAGWDAAWRWYSSAGRCYCCFIGARVRSSCVNLMIISLEQIFSSKVVAYPTHLHLIRTDRPFFLDFTIEKWLFSISPRESDKKTSTKKEEKKISWKNLTEFSAASTTELQHLLQAEKLDQKNFESFPLHIHTSSSSSIIIACDH